MQRNDNYLQIWEKIDFTAKKTREEYGHLRDIKKEKEIESEITKRLREIFSFRFIVMHSQMERMGSMGLESSLIGTIAHCLLCKPSSNWLGNYSPKAQIRESGFCLVQHLKADGIDENDKETILNAIKRTKSTYR